MKTNTTYANIPNKFAGLENAKTVLIPVPYDGTSTWGKGADKGPAAFLHATENMELYDIETDSEVYKKGIHLAEAITENSSPDAMVNAVHTVTKAFIKSNKFVTLFGGEHSISIGSIRAFHECYDNLTVLQLDAHTDLRKEYAGSEFNHACALYEANQNTNLIQVGIRSMDAAEKLVIHPENVFFAQDMVNDDYWVDNALELMTNEVYITFDLDAFDPSILPATGTPEPGGLLWYETLDFLKKVFQEKNVVGFDIVELCPKETDRSSDFAAAKLYYKMLSYKFMERETPNEMEDRYGEQKNKPFANLEFDEDEN